MSGKMITEKTWAEFHASGFLWFLNRTLHIFGWAIVLERSDSGEIARVYPARTKFRGFDSDTNDEGYSKITKYMAINSEELLKEI